MDSQSGLLLFCSMTSRTSAEKFPVAEGESKGWGLELCGCFCI